MALTFYCGSGSPYAWRVWLALEHKQLAYDLKMLSFDAGDLKRPEYLAIAPRGKVPAIVDDGFALWESAAIVEYLEERNPERPLFPSERRARAEVRRIIHETDSYIGEPLEQLVAQLVGRQKPNGEIVSSAQAALSEELVRLEQSLDGREWLAGALSAADHAVYPLLSLIFRLAARAGLTLAPGERVVAWRKRVESLPYFATTYPPHWKG